MFYLFKSLWYLFYSFAGIFLTGVPFYLIMHLFSYVLAKKFTNLDKKLIYVISFAISALIYSAVAWQMMRTPSFSLWLHYLLIGLMVSIPFYSTLWYFLLTFEKTFPNRSNALTHSVKNVLSSFTTTALIFSFIFFLMSVLTDIAYSCCDQDHNCCDQDHKNGVLVPKHVIC